jgi:hypothetical protein
MGATSTLLSISYCYPTVVRAYRANDPINQRFIICGFRENQP